MKKEFISVFCFLIFLVGLNYSCFSLGSRDIVIGVEELLQNNPDFVSIEGKWINELGEDYQILLTKG